MNISLRMFCILAGTTASTFALATSNVNEAIAEPNTTSSADTGDNQTLGTIDVTAQLDASRNSLSPDTGSSKYVFDKAAINQLPLGADTPLNQVLLQAPGVVQDSYGQLHVRGDHANLDYRINGVIIPESISGFGQIIDTRFADKIELLTGTLPAQYGYHTAGVVNITTKNGIKKGGSIGILAGSYDTMVPSLEFYGSSGALTYYLTGNLRQSDIGIENPTPNREAIHDHDHQFKGFGYFSYVINDSLRTHLALGATHSRFQIPNNPDQVPSYSLTGVDSIDSRDLNSNQREVTRYAVGSLQGLMGNSDFQASLFQRYTSVHYRPDPIGDLVFNGVAADIQRSNRSVGVQADISTPINASNTLRYGIYVSRENALSHNASTVFPADAEGNQTSTNPFMLVDDSGKIAHQYGIYVQDQWQTNDKLSINYGLRADRVNAYVHEGQISPRLGAIYQCSDVTTLHAGYARYFTPAPTELIALTDIALFQGTTNALPTNVNTNVKSERSNYFDAGMVRNITSELTVGLDAYYREVRNLQDEGQFGAALIFSPFNYNRGHVYGLELTANYTLGNFSAYFNGTRAHAVAKQVISGQFNFAQDELNYIASHYVHLDHAQKLSGSGGMSYDFNGTRISADFLFGSGLRSGFANTEHLPSYTQVNLAMMRNFNLPALGKIDTRIAIINVFDHVYEIRDGSGIGVGAPQFGPRRGIFVGFTKNF